MEGEFVWIHTHSSMRWMEKERGVGGDEETLKQNLRASREKHKKEE